MCRSKRDVEYDGFCSAEDDGDDDDGSNECVGEWECRYDLKMLVKAMIVVMSFIEEVGGGIRRPANLWYRPVNEEMISMKPRLQINIWTNK